jgi:hypothetical protein
LGSEADDSPGFGPGLGGADCLASLDSALEYDDFARCILASALLFRPLFFPSNDPASVLIGVTLIALQFPG